MRTLVSHAYRTVPFYREFYDSRNFKPAAIREFEDLEEIPIISKDELQKVPLAQRSGTPTRCYKVNTGGTTGQPLGFYMPRRSDALEYAHMHRIWRQAGYRPTELKLSFRGENLGNLPLVYRIGQNELVMNTYASAGEQCLRFRECMDLYPVVKYLHGYPSLVARFCEALDSLPALKSALQQSVKGIFLGSEFPAPHYRKTIRSVFDVPVIAWYGHTERAVLARELGSECEFEPFHTYGFAEAVKDVSGRYRLVATSFSNTICPFIRYDTGDLIEPVYVDSCLLKSFRITEGRAAEEILDFSGNPISLTGLVFGRHHEIFDYIQHLQVEMLAPGKIVVWVTAREDRDWKDLFDSSGLDVEIKFRTISDPIRSSAGKVPLLIRQSASDSGTGAS